tara:strand:- start:390 stop:668 length:279 start_codon:yes stop_codon:yes gene_type:complete
MPKWTITGIREVQVDREMEFEVEAPTWKEAKALWSERSSDRRFDKETKGWRPSWHTERDDSSHDPLQQRWQMFGVVDESGSFVSEVDGASEV